MPPSCPVFPTEAANHAMYRTKSAGRNRYAW